KVTGCEVPTREAARRPGDPPVLIAASDRIRSELGWEPHKPGLEDIVSDAWAFARARPHGYSE
ncbi:MAG: UDP-glucose 4-epimerase GalE, partial [Solirubrobacterales bacterium]|nr:UDP-glucose 4-epimerase GalE [Solirubrobacterales bacterium]